MPIFKVEGVVTLGGGFAYEFEAPDETMARDMARNRALDEPWDDAEIQEVEIQYLAQDPPSPPPSARVEAFAPDLSRSDVTTIAMLLDLELTAQRAAGNPIDAAYLRLHAEFIEMAKEILNDGKKEST